MEKVAIILVNYKDYANRFLAECRDSLRLQDYPGDKFKIFIVDNASSKGSLEYLNTAYPEAEIIARPDGNYSAANNAGIKRATEQGFKLFVIANMDTKFDHYWLRELVKAVNTGEQVGIAQSKILLYPKNKEEWNNPLINSSGNIMHFLGFGFTSDYGKKDYAINSRLISGYASGCSLIIKKQVLDKTGGYDEEYYMYHDDIELCWRAKLAGYKIALAPDSRVFHKYEFSRSILMFYYMERNRYLAMFSYYKFLTILIILPMILAMDLGILAYSAVNGNIKAKLKVYLYFLKRKTWQHVFQVRKKVRKFRIVRDKEIIQYYSGSVRFQEIDNLLLKYIGNPLCEIYWRMVKKIILW